MMKQKIIVSKNWNNPEILINVFIHELEIAMDIDSFLECIVEEIGNPTFIVTKEKLKQKLAEANKKIVEEMKKATVYI